MAADCGVVRQVTIGDQLAGGPALDADDLFGYNAIAIGDVDGDGITDIAVGALGDDDGALNAGAVYIVFLNADGTARDTQKLSRSAGGLTGLNGIIGANVSGIGDLNGDGTPDIALGVWGQLVNGVTDSAVFIVLLNPDGSALAQTIIGNNSGGYGPVGPGEGIDTVGLLGDLDGDGVNDLIAGAPADPDGGPSRGAGQVLFMNVDGTVRASQQISDNEGGFTGVLDDGDRFGRFVAGVGDLDGDGVHDIAVSASSDDDGFNWAGAVWLLHLNTDGTVKSHVKVSATTGGFSGPLEPIVEFAMSVAPLGDFDLDGAAELAIGAPFLDRSGIDKGAVFIVDLGPGGTVIDEFEIGEGTPIPFGIPDGGQFGRGVSSLGDLDGDGTQEFLVSAPDSNGSGGSGVVHILTFDGDHDGDSLCSAEEDDDTDADQNPTTNPNDSDGDGTPDYRDSDDDGDGLATLLEAGRDSDSDGTDDHLDPDDDGDGVLTAIETDDDTDADGLPNHLDLDSDDDGFSDTFEDPLGDSDGDGTVDRLDPDPISDLAVSAVVEGSPVVVGETAVISLTITNNGPFPAVAVSVWFPELFGDAAVVMPPQCDRGLGVILCNLGTIAPTAGVSVSFTITVPAGTVAGVFEEIATASSSSFDPSNQNDAANIVVEAQTSQAPGTTTTVPSTTPPTGPIAFTGGSARVLMLAGALLILAGLAATTLALAVHRSAT